MAPGTHASLKDYLASIQDVERWLIDLMRVAYVTRVVTEIKNGFNPEMSNSKDIELIQDNARAKCPPSMKEFCDHVTHSKLN